MHLGDVHGASAATEPPAALPHLSDFIGETTISLLRVSLLAAPMQERMEGESATAESSVPSAPVSDDLQEWLLLS